MRREASFTYYGETSDKNRVIRLFQNLLGTYTVDVEGAPRLTQTTSDKSKAEGIFTGWWEMSQRDWGASDIDWKEWI